MCGSNCVNGIEAFWNLATLAVGEVREITINAQVLPDLTSGTLIVAPIRVTSPEMKTTINLINVVPIAP